MKIVDVEDHGIWRGRRTWTVTVEDDEGKRHACSVPDHDTREAAEAEALQMMANKRKFTAEETAALRRSNEALQRQFWGGSR